MRESKSSLAQFGSSGRTRNWQYVSSRLVANVQCCFGPSLLSSFSFEMRPYIFLSSSKEQILSDFFWIWWPPHFRRRAEGTFLWLFAPLIFLQLPGRKEEEKRPKPSAHRVFQNWTKNPAFAFCGFPKFSHFRFGKQSKWAPFLGIPKNISTLFWESCRVFAAKHFLPNLFRLCLLWLLDHGRRWSPTLCKKRRRPKQLQAKTISEKMSSSFSYFIKHLFSELHLRIKLLINSALFKFVTSLPLNLRNSSPEISYVTSSQGVCIH